jgi:formylglycine-generating enzyme
MKRAAAFAGAGLLGCLVLRVLACGASGQALSGSDSRGVLDAAIAPMSDAGADTQLPDAVAEATGSKECVHPTVVANCESGFCKIPAGCYMSGSPADELYHGLYSEDQVQITLTRGFLISRTEVTQAEWEALGFHNPTGDIKRDYVVSCMEGDCPVSNVSWYEALAYANARSTKEGLPECYELKECTGEPGRAMECQSEKLLTATTYECKGYRLPNVAEWQYAARAGTTTPFYGGPLSPKAIADCYDEPSLNDIAWYCHNSMVTVAGRATNGVMPVGKKRPNGFGLHDMLGNAAEWMFDHARGRGFDGESVDPGKVRREQAYGSSVRGGSSVGVPVWLRVTNHHEGSKNSHDVGLGFRVARTLE